MGDNGYLTEFARLARNYCNFSEQEAPESAEVALILKLVSALYASAFLLKKKPGIECLGPNVTKDISDAIFKRFGSLRFNYYRVVDDPEKIPGDQPSAGDLADDLRDIYVDLKSGLASFDAGDINQAEEDWRTSFYLHWGQHATNVISVLHKHGAPNA
ncbi:MAG: DUF5063 domain-containing protein [Candidatus Thiodiazotropha sp. (ex Lucinoma borealis)]|nr:DUF5063 domain-containing protein [Candidatus Thiodiazotropha sp. (ex Lucinoma borealis)]MCU7862709.1 DUF5063 domain-containing protein [Candidatus Thiodiazotropha sp. (ex Lucinoma borealis)]